jgi:cobalt/nickel transport system permease protein
MDRRLTWFLGLGLLVTLLVAGGLSLFASGEPDGLERVSIDKGFEDSAGDHAMADSPLADYGMSGVEGRAGTSLAGIIGVAATLVVTLGLLYGIARYRRRRTSTGA